MQEMKTQVTQASNCSCSCSCSCGCGLIPGVVFLDFITYNGANTAITTANTSYR